MASVRKIVQSSGEISWQARIKTLDGKAKAKNHPTKKAAEVLSYTYHYLYKIDMTIFRYFTVYGPAGRPDMMPFKFVQRISEGRTIPVFGDATQSRDFTYVDDIARGTILGLKPLGYEQINLGSDAPIILSDAMVAFMPDGRHAYVNAENDGSVVLVDVIRRKMLKTIALGKPGVIKPMAVLLSPDATRLYVSTGRGHQVFTVSTATNTVVGSVTVGQRPWGIALSPDGRTLYSANGPSNDMSVVDLATNTVSGSIRVGSGPWGVVALGR